MINEWIENGFKINPQSMKYRSITKEDGFIKITYKDNKDDFEQKYSLSEFSEILKEQRETIKNL